jgi:hypothetical protein
MVWGTIGHNFKSPLIRVEGNVNVKKYKEIILQSDGIDTMDSIYGIQKALQNLSFTVANKSKSPRGEDRGICWMWHPNYVQGLYEHFCSEAGVN